MRILFDSGRPAQFPLSHCSPGHAGEGAEERKAGQAGADGLGAGRAAG
jgi:hypothetical protein